MDDEREKLDLARFFPYRIAVLATRISRRIAAVYEKRFGINAAEWRVIAHLARCRSVSVREIHNCVNLEKPRVSRAVSRLEAARIVEKAENASDRRLVEISLTRKGWRVYNEIAPIAVNFEADLLGALTQEERLSLHRVFNKLHDYLDHDALAPRRSALDILDEVGEEGCGDGKVSDV